MEFISILNDVLGPVMRGPSSSHTAGSYHIGRMARSLLGDEPISASFTFAPNSSYAQTFRQQAADLALASGIAGIPLTDKRFFKALDIASKKGIGLAFSVAPLENPDHPNTVKIELASAKGKHLEAVAKSVGGGGIVFSQLEGWPVDLKGKAYEVVILAKKGNESSIKKLISSDSTVLNEPLLQARSKEVLLQFQRKAPLDEKMKKYLESLPYVRKMWISSPVFYIKKGEPIFLSAEEMVRLAKKRRYSLGQIGLAYESELLGFSEKEVMDEVWRRFQIMKASVKQGLAEKNLRMKLLKPSARKIFQAEAKDKVALGGIHTRSAARAMAVMHVTNSLGIVCAAPTGGAAGTIPGVVVTLAEEKKLSPKKTILALLAASAVGLIIARRATFAAEEAGCQVEIGAAGAMAAAACVEAAGGSPQQAVDAAAISLQNTMGSVCDLIQGMCEIPCHTRNAIAASSAFVCADLIIGGYKNPIPLDETIDAVYSSGKMIPPELRCTSRGGLAITSSALSLGHKETKNKT